MNFISYAVYVTNAMNSQRDCPFKDLSLEMGLTACQQKNDIKTESEK